MHSHGHESRASWNLRPQQTWHYAKLSQVDIAKQEQLPKQDISIYLDISRYIWHTSHLPGSHSQISSPQGPPALEIKPIESTPSVVHRTSSEWISNQHWILPTARQRPVKQEGTGMHCDALGILSQHYDVQRHHMRHTATASLKKRSTNPIHRFYRFDSMDVYLILSDSMSPTQTDPSNLRGRAMRMASEKTPLLKGVQISMHLTACRLSVGWYLVFQSQILSPQRLWYPE